jgi:hypothetical protein
LILRFEIDERSVANFLTEADIEPGFGFGAWKGITYGQLRTKMVRVVDLMGWVRTGLAGPKGVPE